MTSGSDNQWDASKVLVVVAAFASVFLSPSANYHVGVLNIGILETFSYDFVAISWLLSLYCSMFALAAPLASVLINLTNCRTCVLASGLITLAGYTLASYAGSLPLLFLGLTLAGLGHALAQMGSVLILAYTFPDDVAVVNGICLAGAGLGSFVHPMLLQTLIDNYGLRGALLLIGALTTNTCATALLLTPTKYETRKMTSDLTHVKSVRMAVSHRLGALKEPVFCTFVLGVLCYAVCLNTILVYLPEYIVTIVGISKQQASIAASTMGAGSVLSRLFTGFAASDHRIGGLLLFVGLNGLAGLLCFISKAVLQHFVSVAIFTAVIGLYVGGTFSLITPIVVDIVSVEQASSGYGLAMMALGVFGFVGPPTAAQFLQLYDFHVFFTILGIIFIIAAAFGMVTALLKKSISDMSPSDQQPDCTELRAPTSLVSVAQQEAELVRFIEAEPGSICEA